MKKYNNFLNERSSLTKLGISEEVMKEIQVNFELDADATWTEYKLKKDILQDLKKESKSFFISISTRNNVQIFINNNQEYTTQFFKYESDGWGSFRIDDRKEITFTQMSIAIMPKNTIFKLDVNDFKLKPKNERRVEVQTEKLEKATEEFKIYILKNFNNIITRIYGNRHKEIMVKITKNLSNISADTTAEELLVFLSDNKKLAVAAKEYENAVENGDILRINRVTKQYNSLTILDDYLLEFESEYSNKFNDYLNIKDLISTFGSMQIETSFMYYLYTGKIKELRIDKQKIKKWDDKKIFERSDYFYQDEGDEHQITKVTRDDAHTYRYCDGILYQESNYNEDIMVDIDLVSHTDENEFYSDQIERYVKYFKDGGIIETFPVSVSNLGDAYNLEEMIEYLDNEDYDLALTLFNPNNWEKYTTNEKMIDSLDMSYSPDEYGIDEFVLKCRSIKELDKMYAEFDYDEKYEEDEDYYWSSEFYDGFCTIFKYWDDEKVYNLLDFNHRFAALKQMGKKRVYVDPS